MQTEQIVALLVAERDRLSKALEALQGPTRRRGRPPKSPLAVLTANASFHAGNSHTAAAAPHATRKGRTPAQRKAQAEKMRAYWKKRKASENGK
jgi:hypothetical protein